MNYSITARGIQYRAADLGISVLTFKNDVYSWVRISLFLA